MERLEPPRSFLGCAALRWIGHGALLAVGLLALAGPAAGQPAGAGPYTWYEGPWSPCSKTCGTGTQIRTVECRDSGGATVMDSLCTEPKPPTVQECNLSPCPTYEWVSTCGPCSEPCNTGSRNCTVTCEYGGSTVPDSACVGSGPKPPSVRSCNEQACVWVEGMYGDCQTQCPSSGISERTVECQDGLGGTILDSFCLDEKPPTSEACTPPDVDSDGFADDCDNCPSDFNPMQNDGDADGVGNVCDQCAAFDDSLDVDFDTLPDACDPCSLTSQLFLSDLVLGGTRDLGAIQEIWFGDSVTVLGNGDIRLSAPTVRLDSGFRVLAGGKLVIDSVDCSTLP